MVFSAEPELFVESNFTGAPQFRNIGSVFSFRGYRVEVRDYVWPEPTVCSGITSDSAQMLMLHPSVGKGPYAQLERGRNQATIDHLGTIHFVPDDAKLTANLAAGHLIALWCICDPAMIPGYDSIAWNKGHLSDALDVKSPLIRTGMQRLIQEITHPGLASDLFVEGTMLTMTAELSRMMADTQKAHAARLSHRELSLIDTIIEGSRTAPSLGDIAAQCGISRRHLIRSFRQSTGTTLGQHALELRLNRAKRLMSDPSLRIKQIAFECGFSSAPAFSAAFHRVTGCTPTQYMADMAL